LKKESWFDETQAFTDTVLIFLGYDQRRGFRWFRIDRISGVSDDDGKKGFQVSISPTAIFHERCKTRFVVTRFEPILDLLGK
jgi:hypothetical protein